MASPSRLPSMRRPAPPAGRSRPLSMIEIQPLNADSNASMLQPTSVQAKRRSLLPQSAGRASAYDELPDRVETVDEEEGGAQRSTGEESKSVPARRTLQQPSSRLTRPTSVYGVPGMGRAPAARSLAAPKEEKLSAREESLAKLTGSKPTAHSRLPSTAEASGLRRTASVKPPQTASVNRGLSRTTSLRSNANAAHNRATSASTIPPAAPPTHTRGSMSVGGPPSRTPGSTSPTSPGSLTTSRLSSTAPTRAIVPPNSRPAFNTYQQHYSPMKSARPKPPLPSGRASQPAPAAVDESCGTEMTLEQIELLQLSLLHQSSGNIMREYEASARRHLSRKHAKLQSEYKSIHGIEREQRRLANLAALEAWCPDAVLLTENLHILGRVHAEVRSLTDEEGRYAELVAVLEAWVEDAEGVFANARVGFVERLPEIWRSTHASLALRLRAMQRDLASLPPPPPQNEYPPSAVGSILRHCTSIVAEMLKEMEVMTKLEREILQCEQARLNEAVNALSLQNEQQQSDVGSAGWVPAWQRVS
ncbi:Hypothetical protein R9X50_00071900 [Acrodontium crateriforme]|uniref:Uncharacterized protein n=1 Tax=Acrodontium crateriforme TaxID=150365 RepID=A0AAQ3LYM2_9PEZI|nr:Hypothetical protein R9X50_00071900 [Acrodontium crateriforme]